MPEVNHNKLHEQVREECRKVWKELAGDDPGPTFDPLMGNLHKSPYRREITTINYKIVARYRIYSHRKDKVLKLIDETKMLGVNRTEIVGKLFNMVNRRELDNRDVATILFYGGLIKDPIMADLIRLIGKKYYIQNYIRSDKFLFVDMLTRIKNPWNLPICSNWKTVIFRIQDDHLVWVDTIRRPIPSYWGITSLSMINYEYKRVLEETSPNEWVRKPYDPFDLVKE